MPTQRRGVGRGRPAKDPGLCGASHAPKHAHADPSGGARDAAFCVLSSSSGGNCSMLVHGTGRMRRVTLIDCGLSPLRTRRMLASFGLELEHVDDVLLTHLDSDHFYPGWARALPRWARHARLRVHARHAEQARRTGVALDGAEAFDGALEIAGGIRVNPTLLEHDEWGVAAFRFDFGAGRASLGYATDLGRPTDRLIAAMAGVEVLAIESNYCPVLQTESPRPWFLKKRIMGGSGHLSNEQCAEAVRAIGPSRHVVLLHLSRECNRPALAAAHHSGSAYALTVSRHDGPTPMIPVVGAPAPRVVVVAAAAASR